MPEADLALLQRTAEAAGDIALSHFRNAPRVWDKDAGAGPVTEADLEVDAYLRETLTAARPGTAWLSEETPDTPDRLTARDVFVVDPIDGTRAFIEGARAWGLSLALVRDGQPIAAVVHMPALERTYTAAAGAGARQNGVPLTVSARTDLTGATVVATRPNMDASRWPNGVPPVERHFRSSLAYRMCLVASGRFDAMLTLRPAWHWDIAAGALIITEATGITTDPTGKPLTFNTPDPRAPGVIAGGTAVHTGLLSAGPL